VRNDDVLITRQTVFGFSRVAGVLLKFCLDEGLQTDKLLGLIQDQDLLDGLFGNRSQFTGWTRKRSQVGHVSAHRSDT